MDRPMGAEDIAALSPAPERRFKAAQTITGIKGEALAALHLAPPLYIDMVIKALRQGEALPEAARRQALLQAGEIFANAVLCGRSAAEYCAVTAAVTGLPEGIIQNSLDYIAAALAVAANGEGLGRMEFVRCRPAAEQAAKGCAQWRRKGDILAVLAPGNAPGVHAIWPQAIALGYKVAVRPSAREPWTAQRLAAALAQAGLQNYIAFVPAEYDGAEALIKAADRSLVYGGDDVARRYKGRADILVQGPGRSKIIIGKDYPPQQALPLIWESVAGLGGTACVCCSAVLAEGGFAEAQKLARDFYAFAKAKFADSQGRSAWALRLSAQRFAQVMQMAERAGGNLVGAVAHAENPDGTYAVMPLVSLAENIRNPLAQTELPIAAVTFAPFDRAADMPFIGDSLVLTAASADESLIAALEELPGIHNFYAGSVPTIWMRPDVPHDGFLSEFLMTARGYKIGAPDSADLFAAPKAEIPL